MALSNSQIEEILSDFNTGMYSKREIARKHSVGSATVGRITKDLTPTNGSLVDHMIDTTINKQKEMAHFGSLNGADQIAVLNAVNIGVDKEKAAIFFDNSTMQNQELLNLAQSQITIDINEDIKKSAEIGKPATAAIEHLQNVVGISKGTDMNRKQILGVTQPKDEIQKNDKIIFNMDFGNGDDDA